MPADTHALRAVFLAAAAAAIVAAPLYAQPGGYSATTIKVGSGFRTKF